MELIETPIPAGLLDNGIEIFFQKGKLYATYLGRNWEFKDLPSDKLAELESLMEEDVAAMQILEGKGPSLLADRLFIYYKCRCGGFDMHSDIENGQLSIEAWNCQCNGSCLLESHFRKSVQAENGHLSPREMEVIRTLCSHPFPTNSAAADMLNISPKTLDNHRQSVFYKTSCRSIQELTAMANNKGWI